MSPITLSIKPFARPQRTNPKSRKTARVLATVSIFLSFAGRAYSQAPFEPPGNQVIFGAWIDTAAGFSDTPTWFNERLGRLVPVYQVSQPIPLPPYNYTTGAGGPAPANLIERSGTDAAIFLTVYPVDGFEAVTQADIDALANQLADYHELNDRTCFLRYAPEMQGNWNRYSSQPTAFIEQFRQVYTTVKTRSPTTIMVWAPNTGQGYPYGQTFPDADRSGNVAADTLALDTNGDGQLTNLDDPYSPYWPGDQYVDWAGLSIYYKGPGGQDINVVQEGGYCSDIFDGSSNDNVGVIGADSDFYTTYCTPYPNIACMMAESAAAWHEEFPDSGDTQQALQAAWIHDCITNVTMLDSHPRLKLIMQFEYIKEEESNSGGMDLRDFRVTNETECLSELQLAFNTIGDRYSWANVQEIPTSISSAGQPGPITNSLGETVSTEAPVVSMTTRPRSSDFPTLFGVKNSNAFAKEMFELSVVIGAGILGFASLFRWI